MPPNKIQPNSFSVSTLTHLNVAGKKQSWWQVCSPLQLNSLKDCALSLALLQSLLSQSVFCLCPSTRSILVKVINVLHCRLQWSSVALGILEQLSFLEGFSSLGFWNNVLSWERRFSYSQCPLLGLPCFPDLQVRASELLLGPLPRFYSLPGYITQSYCYKCLSLCQDSQI